MAMDTFQKRMSSTLVLQPFRLGLVVASESGFTQGNRQAANWIYSGILAGTAPVPVAVETRRGKTPYGALARSGMCLLHL